MYTKCSLLIVLFFMNDIYRNDNAGYSAILWTSYGLLLCGLLLLMKYYGYCCTARCVESFAVIQETNTPTFVI